MNYRYNIYLDLYVNNFVSTNYYIDKKFKLDNNYVLNISIETKLFSTKAIFNIYDEHHNIIASDKYEGVDDLRLFRSYILKSEKDAFLIKIFSNELFKQLAYQYSLEDMEKELQIINFKNNYELIDLCTILFNNRFITDKLKKAFINKFLYYGYKSYDELIGDKSLDYTVNTLLTSKPTSIESIKNLFCNMAMIDITHKDVYSSKFLNKAKTIYKNIHEQRLENLKTYFILKQE